ncbi:hypothetical protein CAOG_05382, partial [Capsaspora owczarzaki ATCC 30864]
MQSVASLHRSGCDAFCRGCKASIADHPPVNANANAWPVRAAVCSVNGCVYLCGLAHDEEDAATVAVAVDDADRAQSQSQAQAQAQAHEDKDQDQSQSQSQDQDQEQDEDQAEPARTKSTRARSSSRRGQQSQAAVPPSHKDKVKDKVKAKDKNKDMDKDNKDKDMDKDKDDETSGAAAAASPLAANPLVTKQVPKNATIAALEKLVRELRALVAPLAQRTRVELQNPEQELSRKPLLRSQLHSDLNMYLRSRKVEPFGAQIIEDSVADAPTSATENKRAYLTNAISELQSLALAPERLGWICPLCADAPFRCHLQTCLKGMKNRNGMQYHEQHAHLVSEKPTSSSSSSSQPKKAQSPRSSQATPGTATPEAAQRKIRHREDGEQSPQTKRTRIEPETNPSTPARTSTSSSDNATAMVINNPATPSRASQTSHFTIATFNPQALAPAPEVVGKFVNTQAHPPASRLPLITSLHARNPSVGLRQMDDSALERRLFLNVVAPTHQPVAALPKPVGEDDFELVSDTQQRGALLAGQFRRNSVLFEAVRLQSHQSAPVASTARQLQPLTSYACPNASTPIRHVLNVGGPVWALDWCPTSRAEPTQYLAVAPLPDAFQMGSWLQCQQDASSDQADSAPHPASAAAGNDWQKLARNAAKRTQTGLIQIWAVPSFPSSGNQSTLQFSVGHNRGRVWALRWCPKPSDGWNDAEILGHLAAAFGDGSIAVYAIPHPARVAPDVAQSAAGVDRPILSSRPIFESCLPLGDCPSCLVWQPCSNATPQDGVKAQVSNNETVPDFDYFLPTPMHVTPDAASSSSSSSSSSDHHSPEGDGRWQLVVGASSGFVFVYSVPWRQNPQPGAQPSLRPEMSSHLNRSSGAAPIRTFRAHESNICAVDVGPGSQYLVVTGSLNGDASVWDLRDCVRPLHVFKERRLLSVQWTPWQPVLLMSRDTTGDNTTLMDHYVQNASKQVFSHYDYSSRMDVSNTLPLGLMSTERGTFHAVFFRTLARGLLGSAKTRVQSGLRVGSEVHLFSTSVHAVTTSPSDSSQSDEQTAGETGIELGQRLSFETRFDNQGNERKALCVVFSQDHIPLRDNRIARRGKAPLPTSKAAESVPEDADALGHFPHPLQPANQCRINSNPGILDGLVAVGTSSGLLAVGTSSGLLVVAQASASDAALPVKVVVNSE